MCPDVSALVIRVDANLIAIKQAVDFFQNKLLEIYVRNFLSWRNTSISFRCSASQTLVQHLTVSRGLLPSRTILL